MSGKEKKRGREAQGMGAREGLSEWLIKRLDMPPDVLCGGMRVEMRGRERVFWWRDAKRSSPTPLPSSVCDSHGACLSLRERGFCAIPILRARWDLRVWCALFALRRMSHAEFLFAWMEDP